MAAVDYYLKISCSNAGDIAGESKAGDAEGNR